MADEDGWGAAMTMKWMFGGILLLLLGGVSPAGADSRDDEYERLAGAARQLAAIDPSNASGLQTMRGHAVRVARMITLFAVSETEIRSEEKVAPPPSGLLTPAGQVSGGGSLLPVSDVPTSWFNHRISDARDSIRELIALLDKGGNETAALRAVAARASTALDSLARP